MKEIEIIPGVHILPMSKNEWTDKALALTGDDKVTFLEKSNQFRTLSDNICLMVFKTNKEGLIVAMQQAGIPFDPENDIIFIRYEDKETHALP